MMNRLLPAMLLCLCASVHGQNTFDVISATYGAGGTQVDVTARVRSLVVNDGLALQVNADTLGTDPVPNTIKTLTVVYRQNLARRTARAKDFESLRIGNAPAEVLRITRAMYGEGTRFNNVTDLLNARIASGTLDVPVTNETLGGDPAPANKKTITVEYVYNGRAGTVTLNEGTNLRLPETTAAPSLKILRATYSGGRRGATADVTSAIASLVTGDTLAFVVNGNIIGADPAPGQVKTLTVEYTLNGQRQTISARDGETMRVNAAPNVPALKIVRAVYSSGRRGTETDVTSAVASLVTNNGLNFVVNENTMGAPPAPRQTRTLTVEYELNGQRLTATARDGQTMQINAIAMPPDAPAAATLRIINATYAGGRRNAVTVTSNVAAKVQGDFLELTVNADTLGTDPAPGVVKTLTVEYELNGQRHTASARDAETLVIPAITSLTIYRATYGVSGRSIDATSQVNARRNGLQLDVPVTADALGGDPAPGIVKTLTVEYEMNGRRRVSTAQDGETLRLPGGIATSPTTATTTSTTGPCLYRQPNFTGEAICLNRGQELSSIANWQAGFRSLRMNGATSVEIFSLANFAGASQTVTTDTPELMQVPYSWWRYDAKAPVQSIRTR